MALEAPLALKFIKDYFTNTYTTTNSNISFRAINLARSRTIPDAFSDFLGNQVSRFNHISGAFAISSATGDLDSAFNNYKTFQDSVSGSSEASSIWKLINTYHYGFSPLSSDYQIRLYVKYDFLVSGTYNTGNIFVEQASSSSGPWTIKSVMSAFPSTTSFTFTPSTSDNDYFRIRIDNNNTGFITLAMAIGIEVLDV
jgi:hypothetical protein